MQIQTVSNAVSALTNNAANDVQTSRNRTASTETANASALAALKEEAATQAGTPSASSAEEVTQAVDKLNSVAASFNQSIQFSVDADTRKNIVKLVDRETNQVIRQIPTEEAVSIAKAIDRFQGLLIKDKA